ncbi:MAG: winged helix DNA-binding protein [Sphingobium sp.]
MPEPLSPSRMIDMPYGIRDERPALLLVADRGTRDDARALAEAANLRLLDLIPLDQAAWRLDMQVGCDVVLLFCEGAGTVLERLLVQLETVSTQNQMGLVIVADHDNIDLAFATLRGERSQLLYAPDATDLAAALVVAVDRSGTQARLHDIGRESEGARLQQLSDEVGRIARTLEALTRGQRSSAPPSFLTGPRISDTSSDYIGMPALPPLGPSSPPDDDSALTASMVRDMLRARRMRADFLAGDLFADPAWDMLLDLLAARLDHDRVSVSSLCIASAVPPTTALRWLRTLTERGLVVRQADPHDGRRVFIALSDEASIALTRWFAATRKLLGN